LSYGYFLAAARRSELSTSIGVCNSALRATAKKGGKMKTAVIIVDVQNDFLPGGALAVPDGDQVIPVANRVMDRFDLVVATQDWHPANHASFAANHPGHRIGEVIQLNGLPQVLWPMHCVQGTSGAEFAPALNTNRITRVFRKGTDPQIDSYSGLFDNGHKRSTGLGEYLREQNVTDVCVLGLATDYCVKFTALDAIAEGFKVALIEDGCRGVELNAGDVRKAIDEMRSSGVTITSSKSVGA
jgi:nicotinamidase/pyrazinamidase